VAEVVIGEAVALELRPARVPSRALALGIDYAVVAVLVVGLLLVMTLAGAEVDPTLAGALVVVVLVGALVGYPLLWETLTRGRTPGKMALGLRVVRDDGAPIVFRHALVRALAGFFVDFVVLSAGTGVVGLVSSLLSDDGRRVGDLLAGTVVLRERVPRGAARRPLPPVAPGLAVWAAGVEMSAVGDDLALGARRFLARAAAMEPSRRAALADRLAAEVAARVAPAPPPGMPAEPYLAAVLGERRRREIERLVACRAPSPARR
jgi:uncharacterized RDD family membrane protein YckC